ncbi:MAG: type II toxin-antitoxin system VapC family toxin [Chloroflexi bacterium]|nr:type II toxin-antitoxin system VapC family toxin [Chloroflexota bacterium]
MVRRRSRAVFVDSSAWCALFWPQDSNHQRAKAFWRRLLDGRYPLCTTNWTLYEAVTVLACKMRRHDLGTQLLEQALESSALLKADEVEREAVDTFRTHGDKSWSIVDCASFHAIRRRGCQHALAFDEHFRQAQGEFGFMVLA